MPRIGGALDVTQVGAQSTPAAGRTKVYPKSDGRVYSKGPDGAELAMSQNVFVQQAQPTMVTPGIWVELNADGSVKTMWFGTT